MKTVIRIGSRESRLAVTQTEIIKGQIEAHFPHIRVEIVTMKTTGDRILDRSLEQIGGKGLFVKELDQALRKGRVDLSVHSLKDMPMDIPEDLPILAYSKREDPRDVLIFRQGQTESISGGMIGTSSWRDCIRSVCFRESAETFSRDFTNWRKKDFVLRFWQQPD